MRLLSQSDPDAWEEGRRRHALSLVLAEREFDTSNRASGPGMSVATGGSPVCAAENPGSPGSFVAGPSNPSLRPTGLEQSPSGAPSGSGGGPVLMDSHDDESQGPGPGPDSDTAPQRSLSIVYSNIIVWGPTACRWVAACSADTIIFVEHRMRGS
eukprot:725678-Pyramimonas_sp.AAC.1